MEELRLKDWVYNTKYRWVSQITGFDSNGITLQVSGGNINYAHDTAGISDLVRIGNSVKCDVNDIMVEYTKMFNTLKSIARVYDWENDMAGKEAIATLREITKKMFP